MGQSVLDKQTGTQVFYPDGISSSEIERSMSDFNNGTITESKPNLYDKIKTSIQNTTGNFNLDPVMSAKATVGGVEEGIAPLTHFFGIKTPVPSPQAKEAFQNVSPVARFMGNMTAQLGSFAALEAATGGIGGIISKIPMVGEALAGLKAGAEANKAIKGAAQFGTTMGEYGALSSVEQQKETYGNVDIHDVAQEAVKQAGFGVVTGGVLSYISKPLAELSTHQEVIAQSSKVMAASGAIMGAQAAADGGSPRDVALAVGSGVLLSGVHLHGEIEAVRKSSIQELQNHIARYYISETGADDSVGLQVAKEKVMNHAEEVINEANSEMIKKNPEPKKQEEQVSIGKQFNDPYSGELLNYLAEYIPARYVASMDSEERLALANGPWQNLRDISEKYASGKLPEKPAVLNDQSKILRDPNDIEREADARRGIARNKNVLDEVAKSKELTQNLIVISLDLKGGENAESSGGEIVKGSEQAQGVEQGAQAGIHLRDNAKNGVEAKTGAEIIGGEKKSTKVAKDINAQFVKQGFEKLTPEEQSRFGSINIGKQEGKVSEIMSDRQRVNRILDGEESLPKEVHPTIFYRGVEARAIAEGDFVIGKKLAESPEFGKELSLAAQTMRGSQAFDTGGLDINPVKEIQELDKEFSKKTSKQVAKKISKELKEGVEKVKKETVIKQSEWDKFLEAIKC